MRICQVTCDECKSDGRKNPEHWIKIHTTTYPGVLLSSDDPTGDFCTLDCAITYLTRLKEQQDAYPKTEQKQRACLHL